MYQLAFKTLLLCTIPKAVEEAWDYLFGETEEDKKAIRRNKHPRKHPDYTDISQEMYDWVEESEKQAAEWNLTHPKRSNHISKQDITDGFNSKFHTDKSRSSVRRIYTDTKRKDLPPST